MKPAGKRRQFRSAPLRLETLEVRRLLAGDVADVAQFVASALANLTEAQRDLVSVVADSINAFNSEFYRRMQQESGNLFFSPLSLAMAFGMLEAAADDQGAQEIADLFRFDSLGEDLHAAMDALMDSLNAAPYDAQLRLADTLDPEAPSPTELRISNALFSQTGRMIKPDYLALVGSAYEALHNKVDFKNDPEGAAAAINAWASEATEGRIQKVISADDAKPLFALLANAVYFKNPWATPFLPVNTLPQPFHLFNGETIDVNMMNQTARFPYMESEGFRVLELPHAFERFSTVFLLPNDPQDISADSLPDDLGAFLEGLTTHKVNVAVPSFNMQMTFELNEVMQDLGVERVFSSEDVLPNMAPDLRVRFVRQDTFFEMDESGSEAAAVTSIGIEPVSYTPTMSFRADRPFHFLIRDNDTGAIMFMGRQMDPSTAGTTDAPDLASAPRTYHNSENPFDVDRSLNVTISDAILLAAKLREGGPRELLVSETGFTSIRVNHYYDVNNDGMLTLHDAILTVSHLRNQQADSAALSFAAAQLSDDSLSDDAEGELDSHSALDLFMADLGDGLQ